MSLLAAITKHLKLPGHSGSHQRETDAYRMQARPAAVTSAMVDGWSNQLIHSLSQRTR
ncbi:hypothetical protein [Mesorhizobium sp. CAU 1732]|uniref:hypothetical protein n=1 Tax=Mesorhizobium sp. CAU 1732 TaxID=3140358 RepID=UPI003260004C